jgi:hypothetical protein
MKKFIFSGIALAIAVFCSSYTIKHGTYYYYATGVDNLNQYYFVTTTESPFCGSATLHPCLIVSDIPAFTYSGHLAVPQIDVVVVSKSAYWSN